MPFAHFEEQDNPTSRTATRDEGHDRGCRGIEPLRVSDRNDEAILASSVREKFQRAERDEESVRGRRVDHPERREERATLPGRQPVEVVQQRLDQEVESREGKFRLALDTARRDDGASLLPRLMQGQGDQ